MVGSKKLRKGVSVTIDYIFNVLAKSSLHNYIYCRALQVDSWIS